MAERMRKQHIPRSQTTHILHINARRTARKKFYCPQLDRGKLIAEKFGGNFTEGRT